MNYPKGTSHAIFHNDQWYWIKRDGKKWLMHFHNKFSEPPKCIRFYWLFGWRCEVWWMKHKLIPIEKLNST